MSNDIPVVLFAHRRPDTLRRVLACLAADHVPLLHIFSDGPRHAEEVPEVEAVREVIRSITWCEVVVDESPTNLGLGVSIRRGVGRVLRQYGSAIVFEDDIISVPGTYRYLVAALRHYEGDPRVMSVTAWTHPRITPDDVGVTPYFDGKAECWAWGTWASAWEGMDEAPLEIMRACAAKGLDIERYGTDLPKMADEAERKNLWAVGWFYHHMLHGGVCMRPPWSLTDQICWEESRSTTTTPAMLGWVNPPLSSRPPIPESWPEPVEHRACARLWRQAIDGE